MSNCNHTFERAPFIIAVNMTIPPIQPIPPGQTGLTPDMCTQCGVLRVRLETPPKK